MLAGISRRACTTFFLLLCQCPWIVDSLQGPYEGPGSCCSAVCGLQLYLTAEDISWKPRSLWPGIQKEISLLGGDFLCLPSKNHFFFFLSITCTLIIFQSSWSCCSSLCWNDELRKFWQKIGEQAFQLLTLKLSTMTKASPVLITSSYMYVLVLIYFFL